MKNYRLMLALVVGLSVGCSANNTGPCAAHVGNYQAHFVERPYGTCGPISDSVADLGSTLPSGCTGHRTRSADNCRTDVDVTCPFEGQPTGTTLRGVGTTHWSTDGTMGSAVVAATVTDPSGLTVCTSTYDVTYTAL